MPSERIVALRELALRHPAPALASREMRLLYAEGWRRSAGEVIQLRRQTLARAHVLTHMTPVIDGYELIVGRQNFDVQLTPEQAEFLALADQLIPRARGMDSHMALDYEKLITKGTDGVRQEILGYKRGLDTIKNPKDIDREVFYDNCLTMLDALETMVDNYAAHALSLAEQADSPRREELRGIADNLRQVPKYPAKTFYQALQAVQMLTFPLEGLYQAGRPDQYLLPLYEADVAAGTLNEEKALELITCFCLQYTRTVSMGLAVGFMVGGRAPDGTPVDNALTRLFLRSIFDTRLAYPGIGLCVTKDTPDDLLQLAIDSLGRGHTNPALFGDDVITEGLMRLGLPRDEASQYVHSTCVEITPVKRSGVWVAAPYHNLVAPLLDILHGPEADSMDSLEAIKAAWRRGVSAAVRKGLENENRMMYNRTLTHHHPLVSCFVDDCLKRGLDVDNGGARYAYMAPSLVGMANLVDSLIALDHVVFREKKRTLRQFAKALSNDFVGEEPLHAYIMHHLPRYGNDDPEADQLAQEITTFLAQVLDGLTTYMGEPLVPSLFCWIMHERLGRDTGASPDGRLAGFPLGDGSGPAQGREQHGPTASILSSTSWDHAPFIGGIAVNLKLSKAFFEENVIRDTMNLVRVFFERGGFEMQLNVVDRQQLLDAQKNPDAHRDLVVRIGGYSDFFTNLSPQMQEEVLLRTEHSR